MYIMMITIMMRTRPTFHETLLTGAAVSKATLYLK